MSDYPSLKAMQRMSRQEIEDWAVEHLGYKRQGWIERIFFGSLRGYGSLDYRGGPMTLFPGKGAAIPDEIRAYVEARDGY